MTQADGSRQSAFSRWLRTGRRNVVRASDGLGIELKYNPWHDPDDGRFTFAGAGRYHGAGGGRAEVRKPAVAKHPVDRVSGPGTRPVVQTMRVSPIGPTATPGHSGPAEGLLKPVAMSSPNPVVEFAGGVGEGLYGVGKGRSSGPIRR
jgi:hypothetical protein